jgi:hypothetical protein
MNKTSKDLWKQVHTKIPHNDKMCKDKWNKFSFYYNLKIFWGGDFHFSTNGMQKI